MRRILACDRWRHPAPLAAFGKIISSAPALLLAAGLTAAPAAAAPGDDPDWPCVQRKVMELSVAQMWSGPPVDAALGDWREDAAVDRLARLVAARRTPMAEAETLIQEFAAGLAPADRARRLTLLFAAGFELIDHERTQIISGIGRYARKQTGLSQKIDAMQEQLNQVRAAQPPDLNKAEELRDQLTWDVRIYEERAQSLTYVCETPVILEQRIFALGRAIMARLE